MKSYSTVDVLLANHPIISNQISRSALAVVLRELEAILQAKVPGDIAEFGCYIGTSTMFMRRLLDTIKESGQRKLYAYDSFSGLPEKTSPDSSRTGEQFKGGELSVTKKQFLNEFRKANLLPPITHKGWFNAISAEQLPDQLAYAFLDGDFYESIIDSLRLVWPRLAPGGVITIDDYQRAALPGVERAVADFFQNKAIKLHHEHHIAIIRRVA